MISDPDPFRAAEADGFDAAPGPDAHSQGPKKKNPGAAREAVGPSKENFVQRRSHGHLAGFNKFGCFLVGD
jgi:hypothetical protein